VIINISKNKHTKFRALTTIVDKDTQTSWSTTVYDIYACALRPVALGLVQSTCACGISIAYITIVTVILFRQSNKASGISNKCTKKFEILN